MATVRSGALNVFRKASLEDQKAALAEAMSKADVLSLSEVHGMALLDWARAQGFGVVKSGDDTAIVFDAGRFELSKQGREIINDTEGPTGGMRSRTAAYALLRDKKTGQEFWQIAAHTTPPRQGPKGLRRRIRKEQYGSLADLQKKLGKSAPVILAGDLNYGQPKIGDMDRATSGGIMHTLSGDGLTAGKTQRDQHQGLDHRSVVTTFRDGNADDDRDGPIKMGKGKDSLDPRELEREYGFGFQFFKSDPELWDLLQKAIRHTWGVDRFQAELKDTKWYKSHSDIWRQNQALKATDPATYKERLQNYRDQIENLAGQWGAQLTGIEVKRYAERALNLGWSTEQILDHIAKDVRPGKDGGYDGQLSSIEENLRQTALRNGVKLNKKQLQGWMRSIVRGNSDVAEYESYIRRMSAETFSAYGKEIKAGVDLADIAAPYMNSMADILELNPEEINLFDRSIRKALTHQNDKGEVVPMSMTDFEDSLRADKRWQYTDQAHEQLNGYAVALGKMWGVLS